jgi:hypothetical protein
MLPQELQDSYIHDLLLVSGALLKIESNLSYPQFVASEHVLHTTGQRNLLGIVSYEFL